jgi:ABC-2 type transport system permease protein
MNLAIFRKELRSIVRERTFVSTLLLQVFLVLFYSLAILGILVIFSPHTQHSQSLRILVISNEYVDWHFVELAQQRYQVTVGPLEGYRDYDLAVEFIMKDPALLYVYTRDESFRTTYMISELKKTLLKYDEDLKPQMIIKVTDLVDKSGLDLNRLTVAGLVFEFTNLLLIPLLLFLPIYLSGVLYIDLITEETARKTLALLRSAPVSLHSIISQKILAALAVSLAQILAWILILEVRHIHVNNVTSILAIIVLLNIAVLYVAALTTIAFRTRAISQTVFSVFVIIALVTKGFAYNPLNTVTRLAVITLPWQQIAWMLAGLSVACFSLWYSLYRICSIHSARVC